MQRFGTRAAMENLQYLNIERFRGMFFAILEDL